MYQNQTKDEIDNNTAIKKKNEKKNESTNQISEPGEGERKGGYIGGKDTIAMGDGGEGEKGIMGEREKEGGRV